MLRLERKRIDVMNDFEHKLSSWDSHLESICRRFVEFQGISTNWKRTTFVGSDKVSDSWRSRCNASRSACLPAASSGVSFDWWWLANVDSPYILEGSEGQQAWGARDSSWLHLNCNLSRRSRSMGCCTFELRTKTTQCMKWLDKHRTWCSLRCREKHWNLGHQ